MFIDNSMNGIPMFNTDSQLVGLCKTSNIPYVVPISLAKPLISNINKLIPSIDYTPQGTTLLNWLGATFIPQNEILGISLFVENIQSNSIWLNKLNPGDKIIKINNNRISTLLDIERTIPSLAQYKKVNFSIIRKGKEKKINIKLNKIQFERSYSPLSGILVLIVFFIIYYIIYHNWLERTVLFLIGAVVIAIFGHYLNFYDLTKVWEALRDRIDVIYFIVGMNILVIILDEAGLFLYLARKLSAYLKKNMANNFKIFLCFCLLTYTLSLFVNNLTTIMCILPVMFKLSRHMKFDPKIFTVGMIIASNLGGASTMIGDFPNILISTETGIGFTKFLIYMMPICFIELLVFFIYTFVSQRGLFTNIVRKKKLNILEELPQLAYCNGGIPNESATVMNKEATPTIEKLKNPIAVKRGIIILAIVVIGFFISELLHLPPAVIALAGGIGGLLFSTIEPSKIIERISYKDIIFFSGLFILVGAAEASGLLDCLSRIILHLSFSGFLNGCLIIMWFSAIVTAFLNAGPTTALFLPLVANFASQTTSVIHNLHWWALSLGVLAGSSATLTGATAGSVSANMLEEFIGSEGKTLRRKSNLSVATEYLPLSFKEYAQVGIPVALIFLVISSVYIIVVSQI